MRSALTWLVLATSLMLSSIGQAATSPLCPNAGILGAGMFRNTCWGAMFPMKVAGNTVFTSGNAHAPRDHAKGVVLCRCGGDLSSGKLPSIGTPIGYWQPTKLVELTNKPYCMPSMGGFVMSQTGATMGGARKQGGGHAYTPEATDENGNMMHFHTYTFPILSMIKILDYPTCLVDNVTSFDVAMMGETFPTWYDTSLAAVLSPEALLFANPVALAAGAADCVAATATNEPMDSIFWTAGCWGGIYPLSGQVSANTDPVGTSNLYAARALYALGRIGMLRRTMGKDVVKGSCKFPPMRILKKSMFKWQMLYPVPESGSGGIAAGSGSGAAPTSGAGAPGSEVASTGDATTPPKAGEVDPRQVTGQSSCTHPTGRSTARWGSWRWRPGPGENHVYLLWQWVDCCVGVVGG